jgi:Zn-dependent metalloprotease
MVFGDGNKHLSDFADLSIVGHEFGHAVTGNKLNYQGEAGALNEHLSDVWGSLIEQYKKKQTADQADWLIGKGVIKVDGQRFPLRSMREPGTAYYSPKLGQDPQPNHYSKRYTGLEDNGGVHINSGIPNKAFYLFASAQGGPAWEKAGRLWYLTVQSDFIHPNCSMHEFAQATIYTALQHYPHDYKMHQDLVHAWQTVGLA